MKEMSQNEKLSEHVGLWKRILPGQIADHLPIGVALLDEQFILRNCNKRYKKYVNKYSRYHSDSALGMSLFDLSLETIAGFYEQNQDQLIGFLEGKRQPRVNPERAEMMKPYVEKSKHLSKQRIKALANFIMAHQKEATGKE